MSKRHFTCSRGIGFFPEADHPANIDFMLAEIGAAGAPTSRPVQIITDGADK